MEAADVVSLAASLAAEASDDDDVAGTVNGKEESVGRSL